MLRDVMVASNILSYLYHACILKKDFLFKKTNHVSIIRVSCF